MFPDFASPTTSRITSSLCASFRDLNTSNPADDRGRDDPEPRGRCAGFNFAELIRCSDEERVHRAYAASHLIWRSQLHKRGPHEYARHIRGAKHAKNSHRQENVARVRTGHIPDKLSRGHA